MLCLEFQVVAGAEGPVTGPGEDGNPDFRVVSEVLEGLPKLGAGRGVQSIKVLGPVNGYSGDSVAFFVGDELEGHGALLVGIDREVYQEVEMGWVYAVRGLEHDSDHYLRDRSLVGARSR